MKLRNPSLGLALVVSLLWGLHSAQSVAQTREEPAPTYTKTIRDADFLAIERGDRPDRADPEYCEKGRDLCLMLECGSVNRDHIVRACWVQCTEQRFDRCKEWIEQ